MKIFLVLVNLLLKTVPM